MSEERGTQAQPRLLGYLLATNPRRERRPAVTAAAGALGLHGAIAAALLWLTMSAAGPDQTVKAQPLVLYTPTPEAPPPPPVTPPPPTPPATPAPRVMAQMLKAVPTARPAAPEPVKGFQTLTPPTITPPDIPPPSMVATTREADFSGEGAEGGTSKGKIELGAQKTVTAEDLEAAPTFTPYTVAPSLRNREEVARALEQAYPATLRDEGVGGKVLVWFLIDETGKVQKYQVKQSSGHELLDRAALQVAGVMRFSPALNRDKHVPVWVALPIQFSTQSPG